MAEATDRLEALVGEVGEVLAEDPRRSHHLVDAGRRRERRDVEAELGLELGHETEQAAIAVAGVGEQAGDLPELRLFLTRGGAQRLRHGRAEALGENAKAAAPEQLARIVTRLLELLRTIDEDVSDGERRS